MAQISASIHKGLIEKIKGFQNSSESFSQTIENLLQEAVVRRESPDTTIVISYLQFLKDRMTPEQALESSKGLNILISLITDQSIADFNEKVLIESHETE